MWPTENLYTRLFSSDASRHWRSSASSILLLSRSSIRYQVTRYGMDEEEEQKRKPLGSESEKSIIFIEWRKGHVLVW